MKLFALEHVGNPLRRFPSLEPERGPSLEDVGKIFYEMPSREEVLLFEFSPLLRVTQMAIARVGQIFATMDPFYSEAEEV